MAVTAKIVRFIETPGHQDFMTDATSFSFWASAHTLS
jgi:peptide subunit release factor RF-3